VEAITFDLDRLPAGEDDLSAADFVFRVGAAGDPNHWRTLPVPATVTVARGAGTGGADRVTLSWPRGSVRNTWLQVTVKANGNTGLPSPDVFYFGSLVGD